MFKCLKNAKINNSSSDVDVLDSYYARTYTTASLYFETYTQTLMTFLSFFTYVPFRLINTFYRVTAWKYDIMVIMRPSVTLMHRVKRLNVWQTRHYSFHKFTDQISCRNFRRVIIIANTKYRKSTNKCLANVKRPCDCCVLCLRLKSSLCSCAHSISDLTLFSCRHQGCDSMCPVL